MASASTSASRFSAIPQIMGGYEATSGAWPWMTAILKAGESDLYKAQYCGGVLITPTWVLTAGHCVEGKLASEIQVAVGAYDLNNWSGTRIPVKRIVKHPAYVDFNANDIALLELNTASGQQSIAIFSGTSVQGIDPKLLGQMTTLIGWGLADTPTTWYWPEKLRQINLPVVADSYCNNAYGVTLSGSQLCAGYAAAKDACSGDSGGPMMLKRLTASGCMWGLSPMALGARGRMGITGFIPVARHLWILLSSMCRLPNLPPQSQLQKLCPG